MLKVYIHGANASPASMDYLRQSLGGDSLSLAYDSQSGFKNNLLNMQKRLASERDVVYIGHSLGGIYALHLANTFVKHTKGGVTLSTPYGGHAIAEFAKIFMPFTTLLQDVGTSSWPVTTANRMPIERPWCNIVSTEGGVPWMIYPNDGVVTISSQRHRQDMRLVNLPLNHYEIVNSPEAVDIIRDQISVL